MSSSSVYQGLQSCLEPRLMEPRVLRLKLTPPSSSKSNCPSHPVSPNTHEETTTTVKETNDKTDDQSEDTAGGSRGGGGGWSFLQCLTNIGNTTKATAVDGDDEEVYVHPLIVKRSASVLSERSLEMCTESLGSETGSTTQLIMESHTASYDDDTTNGSHFNGNCDYHYSSSTQRRAKRSYRSTSSSNGSVSFPPPLTSISGSSGVRVRPHREGGRLVLEAVSTVPSYFHAERSDGRLRLCLVKELDHDRDDEDEEEEFDDGDEKEEKEEEEGFCCEDTEGESGKVRGEIGVEQNSARPSRCKDGGGAGNRLLWEPFWVAT